MSDITIYYSPFCVVSRNALALIRHAGIEPTVIDYLRNRPSREKLLELLGAMQAPCPRAGEGALSLRGRSGPLRSGLDG